MCLMLSILHNVRISDSQNTSLNLFFFFNRNIVLLSRDWREYLLYNPPPRSKYLWNDAVLTVVFSRALCVVGSAACHTATWRVQVQTLIHVLCFPGLWPSFPVLQSAVVTYVQTHVGQQSKKETHFFWFIKPFS